jgi:drug/metabolite transporter (DMT)-like permease
MSPSTSAAGAAAGRIPHHHATSSTGALSLRTRRLGHRAALAALHVAVALFGFAALFGKWIELPATSIVLGRTAIAAATLAAVAQVRAQPIGRPDGTLLVNGAILAVHWVSFFAAIRVGSVAIALLGYASFPLFALLLERGRAIGAASREELVTAALATLGIILLVRDYSWSSEVTHGLALGLVSGFTFAWLAVRNRRLVAARSATSIALWQNAFAAVCLVPVALVAGHRHAPDGGDLVLLVVLGVLCTGFAHTLFIASMRRVSAHRAAVVAALEPVYGIALAAALLGEIPDARTLAGGALIVTAALVASRRTS